MMVGFPKHLNTKDDYEYIRKHFSEDEWRPHWQALLDGKDAWIAEKKLADTETGVVDKTHKVIEIKNTDGSIERYQVMFKRDPHSKLLRLAFTPNQVVMKVGMIK